MRLCGFEESHRLRFDMTRERFSRDKCQGIKLLDYKSFFPVGWMNQVDMIETNCLHSMTLAFKL